MAQPSDPARLDSSRSPLPPPALPTDVRPQRRPHLCAPLLRRQCQHARRDARPGAAHGRAHGVFLSLPAPAAACSTATADAVFSPPPPLGHFRRHQMVLEQAPGRRRGLGSLRAIQGRRARHAISSSPPAHRPSEADSTARLTRTSRLELGPRFLQDLHPPERRLRRPLPHHLRLLRPAGGHRRPRQDERLWRPEAVPHGLVVGLRAERHGQRLRRRLQGLAERRRRHQPPLLCLPTLPRSRA